MKNILFLTMALLISNLKIYAEGDCTSFSDDMICGKHLLYIERLSNNNIPNPAYALQLDVTLKEFDQPNSATILNQTNTNINDATYFTHIGAIQLTNVSSIGYWDVYEVHHGYTGGFTKKYYTIDVMVTNSTNWYSPHLYYLGGVSKTCGNCPTCFHKDQFIALCTKVYNEFYGLAYHNVSPPNTVPIPFTLNWIDSLKSIFVPFVLTDNNFTAIAGCDIHGLCCDEGDRNYEVCNCYPSLLKVSKELLEYVNEEPHTASEILNQIYEISNGFDCSCLSDFCYFIDKTNNTIEIHGIPSSNPEYPAVAILFQLVNGVYKYGVGVNYPLVSTLYNSSSNWSYNSIIAGSIVYTNSSGFTTGNGFMLLNEEVIKQECDIDCENCITSFAPFEQKEYIISAWVREESFVGKSVVNDAALQVDFLDIHGAVVQSTNQFQPQGSLIDGWARIFEKFIVPGNVTNLKVNLLSLGAGDVYFDDIRIFPADGSMKSFVYDPVSRKLVAELDEQNYASIYEYDEEGQLVRVKKETERGVMTIKEVRSNLYKK
jgi:hypothetical protein